jgi:hypothetical protein
MAADDVTLGDAALTDRVLCDSTLREVRSLCAKYKLREITAEDFAEAVSALLKPFEAQTDLGARLRDVLNRQRG